MGARPLAGWCRRHLVVPALLCVLALSGCGGGGGGSIDAPAAVIPPAAGNSVPMTVDRGADGTAFNLPFVSVTVCVPGTATCRTIDHVLVDTGSYGLRIAAAALGAGVQLPAVTTAAGAPVGECAQFARGATWGAVRRADVKLAGEVAANLPIQVVADPGAAYATAPSGCSTAGGNVGVDGSSNGILGVGLFVQDCPGCVASTAPGVYFACPAGGCTATRLELASQVSNPVAAFSRNNNGVLLTLPEVPQGGAATVSGSLIFGIGTQPNNQLGAATVYATDGQGNFRTTYRGVTTPAFLDSGSNALFFADASLPVCSGFYCPSAPLTLSAVNTSATGVSGTVSFRIESLQSIGGGVAAAHVGANIGLGRVFDWGLPFFFGRSVFVAVAGAPTPRGPGPYWAY
jgi:hypothetical protein